MTPRFLASITLSLVLALAAPPAFAAAAPVASAAPSADTSSAALSVKRAEAAAASAKLDAMRSDLATKLAAFQKLDAQLTRTRARIASATAELRSLDGVLAAEQPMLDERADHMYRNDEHQDLMGVLLGTTSLDDLVTRIDFLMMVSRHDAQLIDEVKTARQRSAEVKAGLQERESELVALRDEADKARARVQADMETQQKALDGLNADVAALVRLREASQITSTGLDPAATDAILNGGKDWLNSPSLLLPAGWATVDGLAGQFRIPATAATAYRRTGIAFDWVSSTYGNADNSPTPTSAASSRPYNENELTCANKTLPFGTLLAVSYNGKQVIVVVTDRGPYISGRSLDLSTAAAREIGLPGVAQVHVEIVVPAS